MGESFVDGVDCLIKNRGRKFC